MDKRNQFLDFLANPNTKEVLAVMKGQAIEAVLDTSKSAEETLQAVYNMRAVFGLHYTFEVFAQNIKAEAEQEAAAGPRLVV